MQAYFINVVYKEEKIILIVSIVSLVCFFGILNAYGQFPENDRYEYLGIRHDKNPHVCLFEPNPTYIDWDYWLEVEKVSHQAILDWQTEMTEFLPEGDWTLTIHSTVPYVEHWNKIPEFLKNLSISSIPEFLWILIRNPHNG